MKWSELFGSKNINVDDEVDASILSNETADVSRETQSEEKPTDNTEENTTAVKELTNQIKKLQESNRELAVLGQQAEHENFHKWKICKSAFVNGRRLGIRN